MTRSLTSAERALASAARAHPGRRARRRRPARRGRARRAAGRQPDAGPRGAVPAGRRGPRRDPGPTAAPGSARWTVAELEGVFDLRSALEPQLTALRRPARRPGRRGRARRRSPPDGRGRLPRPAARTSTRSSAQPRVPRPAGRPRRPPDARHRAGRARSTRRSCCATSTPTTRRRCAAASPTTSRSSPRSGPATPTWARAVMTAHIHNARAVMVRAATEAAGPQPGPQHPATRRPHELPARCRRRRHLHRRPAGRRGQRRDLAGQDRLHPGGPGGRRARTGIGKVCAEAGIELARDRPGAARHHGRDQRDPRGQGRHASGWSPPRASGRCCRSPAPSCPAGWPAGSSGPSRSRWPRWRTPSRSTSGSPPTARVIRELDEADVRGRSWPGWPARASRRSPSRLINSFADPAHERRIAEIAAEVLPGVPVSLSSRRAARDARVRAHADHRRQRLRPAAGQAVRARRWRTAGASGAPGELAILRSDGGLSAAEAAIAAPVTMLLSGPAGGVTGAVWVAEQCGYSRPDHLRHGRHVHRRRPRPGPHARGSAARPRSAT